MAIIQFNKPNINKPDMGNIKSRIFTPKAKITLLIIACGLAGFGGGLVGSSLDETNFTNSTTTQKQQYVSSESQLISQIAKEDGASVVSVDTSGETSVSDIFGFTFPQRQSGSGTGFIVRDDGIIMTNRHVVPKGTTSVTVTLADGTRYDDVEVLGRTSQASTLDVAFLKINGLGDKKLPAAKLGDSSKMQVGDRVIAIGNALGQFQNTVTTGIISGHGRDLVAGNETGTSTENLSDLFQTDAAINQGNSGGPLVNINGEVIGINTAVAGGAQNIGFAIPINDVKGLVEGVFATGQLQQPYLGVRYVSLTDDLAYEYNVNIKRGAYIVPSSDGSSIVSGSPAEKAGLKEKDIITKVNDTAIDEKTSLASALGRFKVGENIKLTILRGSETITINATLEENPQ